MTGEMSQSAQSFALRSGQFGLSASGSRFRIIGFFLILAALRSDASEDQGLSGALRALEQ